MNTSKTKVEKDLNQRSVKVKREFNAPVELVWKAFTESEILDQWWGPAPWRAETKYMDFSVGGYWLYAMVGPQGEKHWGRMNYLTIENHKYFLSEDAFCDENGKVNPELPVSKGSSVFVQTDDGTRVEFTMKYATDEQLKQIIEMGFEQGITVCFEQLDQLFVTSKI